MRVWVRMGSGAGGALAQARLAWAGDWTVAHMSIGEGKASMDSSMIDEPITVISASGTLAKRRTTKKGVLSFLGAVFPLARGNSAQRLQRRTLYREAKALVRAERTNK